MLRGDHDIFALMDDLSQQQGYQKNEEAATEVKADDHEESSPQQSVQVRMVDDEDEVESLSSSLWNPHARMDSPPSPRARTFMETNPMIEVLRRRAFERFKADFRKGMERAHGNSTKNKGPTSLWMDLSVPSLLEKWHFDVKLEEALFFRPNEKTKTDMRQRRSSYQQSIVQIHATMSRLRSSNEWCDPVLITPPSLLHDKKSSKPREQQLQRQNRDAFGEELMFEWTRAWRRRVGNSDRDRELKETFQSKKFKRKLSSWKRSINTAAQEVDHLFWTELTKHKTQEATRTISSSSTNRRKRRLPKLLFPSTETVAVSYTGLSFSLHRSHYRKLQILFDRQNTESESLEEHRDSFVSSLFCLLARYDTIQGAGLQSAVQGPVFDTLLHSYGCKTECFASPLNCRYDRFCSAFPDVDSPFGSLGSFFDYDFSGGGCFQANPPFVANFILAMCNTINTWLGDSDKNAPLMFVVFVPHWEDTRGWQALQESPHLLRHVRIAQASHYYAEGTQYRRKEQYRVASFDTSIFFLQNSQAKKQWPVTREQIDELQKAFATKPSQLEDSTKTVGKRKPRSRDANRKRAKSS